MGKYLIANDRVLFVHEKDAGWVSWDEFRVPDFIKETPVSVLLTEMEFKKSRDGLGGFSGNMIVQEERLKNGIRQSAGIRVERLEEVLSVFPRESVNVCIPYALSIRAFLIARGLLSEATVKVVLEDTKEAVLLTIFDGMEVLVARVLSGLSFEDMVQELTRSIKRGEIQKNEEMRFIVNNADLSAELLRTGMCSLEEIILIDVPLMAFDVLDRATFGINFLLPEQIAHQRRQELSRYFGKMCAGVIVSVALAVGYAGGGVYAKRKAVAAERVAVVRMTEAQNALKEKSIKVFRAALGKEKRVRYEDLFQSVLINAPGTWSPEKISMKQQGTGVVKIEVVFSGTQEGVFVCEGLLRECQGKKSFMSGKPWIVITAQEKAEAHQKGE